MRERLTELMPLRDLAAWVAIMASQLNVIRSCSYYICTVLENIVSIQAAQSTMFAGASYTLNCTVVSDIHPVVKWTGLDGNPVDANPASNDVTMDEPVTYGNKTIVLLRFRALRTSQAGQYTCQSVVSSPPSVRTAERNVVVTGK